MIHTLTRFIAQDQAGAYANNGWVVGSKGAPTIAVGKDAVVHRMTTREVEFAETDPSPGDLVQLPTPPYFVQRAHIKRPLGKFLSGPFLSSLSFDFMSFDLSTSHSHSPARVEISLHRILASLFAYQVSRFEGFNVEEKGRTFALRVFHPFSTVQYEGYCENLLQIRRGTQRLADISGLENSQGLPKLADLWWDLDNDVICTFDKNYALNIHEMLRWSSRLS